MGWALEHHLPYNEKELLVQASAGDRSAFARLYSLHIDDLYRCIFLFTKSKEDTQEVIQDVFLKMWERKEKLAEIQSFKNYVYIAARSKLISKIRHLQVRHRVLSEIRRNKEDAQEYTEAEVDYKSYYRIVQKAIEQLPPRRKMIFQLSTERGLSLDEIAKTLDISKNVVKKQLYEATDFVRTYLSQHGDLYLPLILVFFTAAM